MQDALRTVKYSAQDAVKFEKIALKLGRPKRLIFSQMVDYFYRSKKDPTDLNDELLKSMIIKGQREHIGFIKTQETDLLIPIKRDVTSTVTVLQKIVDSFNSQVLRQNDKVLANQQTHSGELAALREIVKRVDVAIDTKATLKNKFLHLLNSYIKSRDSMGIMTSSKEKDDLANDLRNQIRIL